MVNNNVFNKTQSGPQRLDVYDAKRWCVVADHAIPDVPKGTAPPGKIKAYPCTQRNFSHRSIESFKVITADWATRFPDVGEWDGAFDNWFGGIGSPSTAEVMVWTHHKYNGVLPPPNAVDVASPVISGQSYKAWRRKNGNGGDYIALVMDPMRPAGSVDLLAIFRWLVSKTWLKATDEIAAIEYGVEIANTKTPAGGPQVFWLDSYNLTAS